MNAQNSSEGSGPSQEEQQETITQLAGLLEDGHQRFRELTFDEPYEHSDPNIPINGWRLTNSLIYSPGEQTQAEMLDTLQRFREKGYYDKMPTEELGFFVSTCTYHYYLNDKFNKGDAMMEALGLSSEQQKNLSRRMLLESMTGHSDPDGVMTYTATRVARRVLQHYPEFQKDEEVLSAAKKAVALEVAEVSPYGNNPFAAVEAYLQMELVTREDMATNESIKGAVHEKAMALVARNEVELLSTLQAEYGDSNDDFWESEEVSNAAKEGFLSNMTYSPEVSKELVDTFLGADFLNSEETQAYLETAFVEAIASGRVSAAAGMVAAFEQWLPNNYINEKVWDSEVSANLEHELRNWIRQGSGSVARDVISVFGLPDHLNAESLNSDIVLGLQEHLKPFYRMEETQQMLELFELDPSIWEQVLSVELLTKMFDRTDSYKISGLVSHKEKAVELGIDMKISETELQKFMAVVESRGVLTPGTLRELMALHSVFPELQKYLKKGAGPNFPEDATVLDLIEYCNAHDLKRHGLKLNSLNGLGLFKMEDVQRVSQSIDRDEKDGTSYVSIRFFNVIKREFLEKTTQGQRQEVLEWVYKWGRDAQEALESGNTRENVLEAKRSWSQHHGRILDREPKQVVNAMLRNKAEAFASSLAIMNDPEKINEIGTFIDELPPHKLYLASRKDIYNMLKGHFTDIHFPEFQW